MGRGDTRGRALKRAREAGEAFEVERDRAVEESLEAARPDNELFFVDTAASVRPPPKSNAEKRQRFFSDKPSSIVMPSVHLVKAVGKMAKKLGSGVGHAAEGKKKAGQKKSKAPPVYDMWGNDGKKEGETGDGIDNKEEHNEAMVVDKKNEASSAVEAVNSKATRGRRSKVLVPLIQKPMGGQSYNPTFEEHQEAIKKAVDVEEKRDKVLEELRKPLGGMSEETQALLLSSDDEEDDGMEEEDTAKEGESAGAAAARRIKRKGKLTKAERNKIRRRKDAEHAALQEKKKKELAKQVGQAGVLAKKMTKKERQAQAQEVKLAKAAKGVKGAAPRILPSDKDPLKARSIIVPLSDELGGGLRLVKSKGSLASETLDSLQRRGQYEIIPRRKSARPKERVRYIERFRGE